MDNLIYNFRVASRQKTYKDAQSTQSEDKMSFMQYLQRKTLPYILATGLALGTLVGCEETKIEVSGILHEDAKVVQAIYSPRRHGIGVSPQIDSGPQVTSIDVPENYAIVFECQHGKFVSEGINQRHKDLWSRLKEGQEVDITYKETYKATYKATYDDINNDGKKDLVERVLIGFDFLDAQPKK